MIRPELWLHSGTSYLTPALKYSKGCNKNMPKHFTSEQKYHAELEEHYFPTTAAVRYEIIFQVILAWEMPSSWLCSFHAVCSCEMCVAHKQWGKSTQI